jgi:hypothetical protein
MNLLISSTYSISTMLIHYHTFNTVGWDCVVSIATCYGLDGLGIKSKWRQNVLHPFRLALELTQPVYIGDRGIPGSKAASAWH